MSVAVGSERGVPAAVGAKEHKSACWMVLGAMSATAWASGAMSATAWARGMVSATALA